MSVSTVERPTPAEEILGDLLDTAQMVKLFGVTELSIHNWRAGKGLPYVRIPGSGRDTIRYRRAAVKEWAEREGRQMFLLPR